MIFHISPNVSMVLKMKLLCLSMLCLAICRCLLISIQNEYFIHIFVFVFSCCSDPTGPTSFKIKFPLTLPKQSGDNYLNHVYHSVKLMGGQGFRSEVYLIGSEMSIQTQMGYFEWTCF
jgi:hypothetical protein